MYNFRPVDQISIKALHCVHDTLPFYNLLSCLHI